MNKDHRQVLLSRALRIEQTEAERLLWSRLRNKQLCQVKFRSQQPIGNYIVDFVSFDELLIIEIDGGQHNEVGNRAKDKLRTDYLKDKGYNVLRFWNSDVLQNIEGVLTQIKESLV